MADRDLELTARIRAATEVLTRSVDTDRGGDGREAYLALVLARAALERGDVADAIHEIDVARLNAFACAAPDTVLAELDRLCTAAVALDPARAAAADAAAAVVAYLGEARDAS